MAKKISRIITRKSPNLECGFFAALLMYFKAVLIHLGITQGKIVWEFVSTAIEKIKTDDQTICFNVGGGQFDQHGQPQNKSLCELCSIDLVRGEYDFLVRRPWLREVYQLIRNNDVDGRRISRHPFNLREIMSGLSFAKEDDPQLVLDWLALAFCGVFENLKVGVSIKTVFDPRVLVQGVEVYDATRSEWFQEYLQLGIGVIKNHTKWAQTAIAKAKDLGKVATVYVPSIDAEIKVIEVWCDSIKTAAMARSQGYQVVIQWNKDGHCQIHGGNVKDGTTKKWLNMSVVACELRFWEAKFCGKRLAPVRAYNFCDAKWNEDGSLREMGISTSRDWSVSGSILFEDGTKVPWYLAEFLTSVYNGTLSSRDVEPTRFKPAKLFRVVLEALPKCEAIIQEGDGKREKVDRKESKLDFDLTGLEF